MASLKGLKGEKVHTRSIRIETFSVDEGRVIVEGTLEDTRYHPIYTIAKQRREAGKVHGMVVRLLLGGMPTEILDAEAEMPTVPMEGCTQATDSVRALIGLPIVYGFSKAVKDRLAGPAGCNHLTSLILTMGSAAVQGMAAHRGRAPAQPEAREVMLEYVKDSCCVWRSDGEHYRRTREEIESVKKQGEPICSKRKA
jgi:hypothetical protein